MTTATKSLFQKALDVVESLPDTQQQHLIEVVNHRLIEARRKPLAQSIRNAKTECRSGKGRKGTAADLIKELGVVRPAALPPPVKGRKPVDPQWIVRVVREARDNNVRPHRRRLHPRTRH